MENKRSSYWLFLIVILIVAGIGLLMPKENPASSNGPEGERIIPSELEKLNVEVTGPSVETEIQLPLTFSDANWGLKKIVCEEGGYDLSSYAGKPVSFTSYNINDTYDGHPLDLVLISSGNVIVCAYKTVREGSNLSPGIFPVN